MKGLRFAVASIVFGIAANLALAASPALAPVPQFDNFPAPAWHGKVAATTIQSEQDHRFAARLRELSGKNRTSPAITR